MSDKVKCVIVRETEKALFIRQEQPNRVPVEVWIPRSQCDHVSKMPDGKGAITATVTMAGWLVDKHNLRAEA
jgi:hypothetical protein